MFGLTNPISFSDKQTLCLKIKFLFSGATFHIPLTKSATVNRLLHCSLWQFSGALFLFSRALFLHFGGEIAQSPRVIFSHLKSIWNSLELKALILLNQRETVAGRRKNISDTIVR